MIINGLTNFRRYGRLIILLLLSVLFGACNALQPDVRPHADNVSGQIISPDSAYSQTGDEFQLQDECMAPPPYVKLSIEKPAHIVSTSGTSSEMTSYNSLLHEPILIDIDFRGAIPDPAPRLAQSSEVFVTLQHEAIEALEIQNNAWYRLQKGMSLPEVDNKRISAQLNWYLKHRSYLQRVMRRAAPILPFVLDELEKKDMPTELALLPVVESAYQAFAYSHGRASGLWQIIPATGRNLGLKQNWWYDGRRDIIESTRAAIRYLDGLAREFNGDWDLALASYNAGPGRVRSAIRYNKKKNRSVDYWNLTRLRKETKDYLPKLYDLKQIFDNPEKY